MLAPQFGRKPDPALAQQLRLARRERRAPAGPRLQSDRGGTAERAPCAQRSRSAGQGIAQPRARRSPLFPTPPALPISPG
jgi:hypothetical protein